MKPFKMSRLRQSFFVFVSAVISTVSWGNITPGRSRRHPTYTLLLSIGPNVFAHTLEFEPRTMQYQVGRVAMAQTLTVMSSAFSCVSFRLVLLHLVSQIVGCCEGISAPLWTTPHSS